MFDPRTNPHVRIYYTLDQMNRLDLHGKVFEAIHTQRRQLLKPEEIADFMAANGINRQQWLDVFNSFSTVSRVNRANQVWQAYKIDGTPMLAIDGRFVTSPSMVGSREGAVAVADKLIERARKERK
jgi:thiol:disulfide interchange protein DsbA